MTSSLIRPFALAIAVGVAGIASQAFEMPETGGATGEVSWAGDQHPVVSQTAAVEVRPASARHRRAGEVRMIRTDVPATAQGRDAAQRSTIRANKGTGCSLKCRDERRAAALDEVTVPYEGLSARDCRRIFKRGADCDALEVTAVSLR